MAPRVAGPARRLPRIALVNCRELPGGDEDAAPLLAACAAAGLDAEWRVWDDPATDWSSYDLVVIRSAWDYATRRDDFTAWAASVPRLANPAPVVAWNTDKTYLRELAAAGLPVVPTRWLAPGDDPDGWADGWVDAAGDAWGDAAGDGAGDAAGDAAGDVVVKPTVSCGGQDTARYAPGERGRAGEHARRLLAAGRPVMVQPYLAGVDEVGETGVVHVGGAYSHGFRKGALLRPAGDAQVDALYRAEDIAPREPSAAERALAARALAAVPGGPDRLLYARVDLLPGPDGTPLVIELELTEPSLYLGTDPGAADRLAAAVRAAVSTP